MLVPFVGPTYNLPQKPMSVQRCVNLFLQTAEKPSKTAAMLVPTPGLQLRATIGVGPIRGMFVQNGFLWVVSGRSVYRVSASFTAVLIGKISTASGIVSMASNGTQILIVDGLDGWIIDVATATLAQITDPEFPQGVTSATFIDQYFVVTGNGTGQFWWSALTDGASWDGLDFSSAEGGPDNAIACIADHRELWVLGENTVEIFVTSVAGFERVSNAFIEHGCGAWASVAKMDNAVYWLQSDERGDGMIYRALGYTPQRISTHAIEDAIRSYPTISDAVAFTYQDRGHDFYVLSFPSGNATWCYDAASGEWHERLYRLPGTGQLDRYRGQVAAFFARLQVVGDWETGALYSLETSVATDNGNPVLRLRSTQAMADNENLGVLLWSRFQVDLQAGVGNATDPGADPIIMLRYSDTGGQDWTNHRFARMGQAGEYWARAKWERCFPAGRRDGRSRVWEVSWTDPVITALLGAAAYVSPGAS